MKFSAITAAVFIRNAPSLNSGNDTLVALQQMQFLFVFCKVNKVFNPVRIICLNKPFILFLHNVFHFLQQCVIILLVMIMKKTIAVDPKNSDAIWSRMSTIRDAKVYRRFHAILFLSRGKTPEEVSELTGFSARHIRNLGKLFNEKGLDAFGVDGRKGGNNRLLTNEEANAFLGEFEKEACAGHVLTVKEMSSAYDERVGITHKSHSTFYRLIHRMGWRKVKPRSKHPKKASDEVIEASKKLTNL